VQALQFSNVETIIVFRACCPLVVSLLDYGFLGRQLPSASSTLALLLLVAGAAGYVASDAAFRLTGWTAYSWATAYFCIISVEMAYGKHIIGPGLTFKSMWGPTLYTNVLAAPPMLVIGFLTREHDRVGSVAWDGKLAALLGVSCIVGVAISYTGWCARQSLGPDARASLATDAPLGYALLRRGPRCGACQQCLLRPRCGRGFLPQQLRHAPHLTASHRRGRLPPGTAAPS
jgi:hypothetical protein